LKKTISDVYYQSQKNHQEIKTHLERLQKYLEKKSSENEERKPLAPSQHSYLNQSPGYIRSDTNNLQYKRNTLNYLFVYDSRDLNFLSEVFLKSQLLYDQMEWSDFYEKIENYETNRFHIFIQKYAYVSIFKLINKALDLKYWKTICEYIHVLTGYFNLSYFLLIYSS